MVDRRTVPQTVLIASRGLLFWAAPQVRSAAPSRGGLPEEVCLRRFALSGRTGGSRHSRQTRPAPTGAVWNVCAAVLPQPAIILLLPRIAGLAGTRRAAGAGLESRTRCASRAICPNPPVSAGTANDRGAESDDRSLNRITTSDLQQSCVIPPHDPVPYRPESAGRPPTSPPPSR